MPENREDLHDELMAMLAAGREMPPADDEHLVDAFLDRVDGELKPPRRADYTGPLRAATGPWHPSAPHFTLSRGTRIPAVVMGVCLLALVAVLLTVPGPGGALPAILAILSFAVAVPSLAKDYLNFRHDRGTLRQEEFWLQTGAYPPVVFRTYAADTVFQRDASRLLQLGYKIQTQQNVLGGQKVTYVQDVNR